MAFFLFQIISWNWKHLINFKAQAKKVFWHMMLHTCLCNALCRFSSKLKATNFFPKHILKLKAHDQSIQARKKLFCRVIVNNYLCNVLCKFLIKMEARGGAKSKNRHPSWLYCTVVGLSETATGGVLLKKLLLKISQYPQETHVLESLLKKLQLY